MQPNIRKGYYLERRDNMKKWKFIYVLAVAAIVFSTGSVEILQDPGLGGL